MATAVSHNQTSNPILRTIEGDMIWTNGPVTYNVVQLGNTAELNAYNAQQALQNPPSPNMTQDLAAIWTTEF